MKRVLFVVCLIYGTFNVLGQDSDTLSYPEVGKPMPELEIHNIRYYSRTKANIREFRGKWLLLDFWNISCGACIASFPYTSEIQRQLGDSIQVLLVGIQDPEGFIEPMYAKFREREGLLMPCAFDSLLAGRLDIYIAPHSILIDPRGIVQCITPSFNIADIRGYLSGNPPILPEAYRRMHDTATKNVVKYVFDAQKPFLVNGNGGDDTDFLFRSVLSLWNRNLQGQHLTLNLADNIANGRFQVFGVTLESLYNYAFFGRTDWEFGDTAWYGKYYAHPILEIRDSSLFDVSFRYNRNVFSYSLIMPAAVATEHSVKKAIQRDLSAFFGYSAKVEQRDCPCLKLVAQAGTWAKLTTKAKTPVFRQLVYRGGISAKVLPIERLLAWIRNNQPDETIVDQTGITGFIDITVDCIPSDLTDLQKALRLNGLDLVPSTIPMYAIVIRDDDNRP